MKLTSLQENLKNGLNIVSHIAGKNVNLPILNNILIKAGKNNIELISTDLEIGIVSTIRGKIEEEGEFTIDSKIIADYISLLPNKKVDLEISDNKLKIKCDNYKTVVNGQSAEDFPLIPQINRDNFYKAKIDDFKKMLSQIIFSVSTSDTRLELTGVLFSFEKNNLTLAATDSFRLAEKTIKIETNIQEDGENKIIVPAKTLQELVRILTTLKSEDLNEENSEIRFYINESQILFTVGKTELISRLIEGQYPDYKQIIPVNNETKALVDKREFLRAVKAASIFSKTGVNDINLDFPIGKNKVIISSTSGQTGENITDLDAEVSGKDNSIVVNYRYLIDGLNNINSDNIKIEITNGNTPCIIRPENDNEYIYIIMPIKQ